MTTLAKSNAAPLNPSLEQCPICLEDFTTQEVGIPEKCQHAFCFSCLLKWTTTEQRTCPNDRQETQCIFKKVFYSSRKPYAKMNISDGKLEAYVDENAICCEECGDSDEEYPLVTCNKCEHSYHSICLNASDTNSWLCPSCGSTHGKAPPVRRETVKKPLASQRTKQQIKTSILQNKGSAKPSGRSQQSSSASRTRQTRPSSESFSRSATLASQARFMAALKNKRKRLSYLPAKVPVMQMPRIQRRVGAPSRPQITLPKSKLLAKASFIDKLLHAQNSLHSLSHVRMQGANIQLS